MTLCLYYIFVILRRGPGVLHVYWAVIWKFCTGQLAINTRKYRDISLASLNYIIISNKITQTIVKIWRKCVELCCHFCDYLRLSTVRCWDICRYNDDTVRANVDPDLCRHMTSQGHNKNLIKLATDIHQMRTRPVCHSYKTPNVCTHNGHHGCGGICHICGKPPLIKQTEQLWLTVHFQWKSIEIDMFE